MRTPRQVPLTAAERELLDERLREHRDNPDDVASWAEVRDKLLASR